LGGALLEEFRYDERGQPLSVTFADYLLPTAADVPPIDVLLTEDAPSPSNQLGIKGAGEGGIAGAGAVIASAVADALGGSGAITKLPITPQFLKTMIDAHERSATQDDKGPKSERPELERSRGRRGTWPPKTERCF
jgi:CO/xanthine dehydrogenase Mo-binding subunit